MIEISETFRVEECPGRLRAGLQCVRLLQALEFCSRVGGEVAWIIAPAGFETDFASIPFGLRTVFPPMGPWSRPAIIHDFLYATRGGGWFRGQRWITRSKDYSRREADQVFREAMTLVGVPAWRRAVMYRAVRLGGASGWGR